jgi:hypothetical protein
MPRANAPDGFVSHWTRPLDVLISILALPLAPLLGVKSALYLGAMLSGPTLHAGAVVALTWAALPPIGRTGAILAGIAATAQYPLVSYGALTRADHHIFYVFVAALGLGLALRALLGERARRDAFLAGLAAAAGVWIGIGGFAFAGVLLAGFALPWLAGRDEKGEAVGGYAAGLAAGLVVALAIERGPGLLTIEYDRLSIVHATLGVLIAGFFAAARALAGRLRTPLARMLAALAGAALAVGPWVRLFPKALQGPLADVDPDDVAFLARNITELGAGLTLERFPALLGATAVAIPWLAWRLKQEGPWSRRWAWALVAGAVLTFGALAAGWACWSVYAGLFPCVAIGDLVARATERIATMKIGRINRELASATTLAAVLVVPPALSFATLSLTMPPGEKAVIAGAHACAGRHLAEALNRPPWPERPRTILMGFNYVGEILYRTPHRTVGMAHHRAERTVRDTMNAFAARDDAAAREIIDRRGIELIAICPGFPNEGLSPESKAAGTLYAPDEKPAPLGAADRDAAGGGVLSVRSGALIPRRGDLAEHLRLRPIADHQGHAATLDDAFAGELADGLRDDVA